MRILLADDREETIEPIRVYLQYCGAEIEIATSGARALTAWESRRPDVLVSDIDMPHLNGCELIRTIRAREGERRILRAVAVSGYGDRLFRQTALLAGFDEHLLKPVEPDVLLQAIVRLTRGAA